MLTNKKNGTLYIGLTSDLQRRVNEHKLKTFKGFTSKYDTTLLVYFEEHESSDEAYIRERQLKKWNRIWKLSLIEKDNPEWLDLSVGWF
jgi:putative endonuclease